jgi:DNA-binding NtrC family response regulator
LIVDPDDLVGPLLEQTLELHGHEPTLVCDAAGARRHLVTKGTELMLLDISPPMLGGFELLRRVHSSEPNLPIVVLSAAGGQQTLQKCVAAGALFALRKPISCHQLLSVVRELSQCRRAIPELRADPIAGYRRNDVPRKREQIASQPRRARVHEQLELS